MTVSTFPVIISRTPHPRLNKHLMNQIRELTRTNRLVYGCWRLAEEHVEAKSLIAKAIDSGFRIFDHADIYGNFHAEVLFGDFIRENPAIRKDVFIATKCGVRKAGSPEPSSPYRFDSSRRYIIESCEASLKRLKVEQIDLYQIHRPDYLAHPEEVASAFEELERRGKVRSFGLSNFRPSMVALYQSACPMALVSNQVEISILQQSRMEDGTLDQCMEKGLLPLAWSPLAAGRLTGGVRRVLRHQEDYHSAPASDELETLSQKYGVEAPVIAISWLLKHPSGILPIVGTTHPGRLAKLTEANQFVLSRDDWYRLLVAGRNQPLP